MPCGERCMVYHVNYTSLYAILAHAHTHTHTHTRTHAYMHTRMHTRTHTCTYACMSPAACTLHNNSTRTTHWSMPCGERFMVYHVNRTSLYAILAHAHTHAHIHACTHKCACICSLCVLNVRFKLKTNWCWTERSIEALHNTFFARLCMELNCIS